MCPAFCTAFCTAVVWNLGGARGTADCAPEGELLVGVAVGAGDVFGEGKVGWGMGRDGHCFWGRGD